MDYWNKLTPNKLNLSCTPIYHKSYHISLEILTNNNNSNDEDDDSDERERERERNSIENSI